MLDINTPNDLSYNICEELRKAGVTAPIIAITANPEAVDDFTVKKTGFTDYLQKPISFKVFIQFLRNYLPKS